MANTTRRNVAYQGKVVGWVRRKANGQWVGRCTTTTTGNRNFSADTEGEAVREVQRTHYDNMD